MASTFRSMIAAATLIVASADPAAAHFYVRLRNGRYLIFPDILVISVAVLAVIFIVGALISAFESRGSKTTVALPDELDAPERAEFYDDQAERARALKRKLDAETELAESFLKGKRVRAELDEIEEILELDKAGRRPRR
jgi:hypothetical protein